MLVGIVGPCAAGKTTLINGLQRRGINSRHIAQEHSYVQDMWRRITNPDILVYLDVSYPLTIQRRKMSWSEAEYKQQLHRLENAHKSADLIINTDNKNPEEVLSEVLSFIRDFNQASNFVGQSL